MAEGILRQKAEKAGLKLKIDSAGTEHYHVGENPDPRALETAMKHGIDISKLVARQITHDDFAKFDFILVADDVVFREVMALARNENDKKKVDYIMNFIYPDSNLPVPDPYYGGINGFEKVFEMLDRACEAIVAKFINSK
jgi:protein-tyrosine phosphatase